MDDKFKLANIFSDLVQAAAVQKQALIDSAKYASNSNVVTFADGLIVATLKPEAGREGKGVWTLESASGLYNGYYSSVDNVSTIGIDRNISRIADQIIKDAVTGVRAFSLPEEQGVGTPNLAQG